MKLLVLDNYDSFTYNLVQYAQILCGDVVEVYRNDAISLEEVQAYSGILLSPGPGLPKDAGIMPDLIKTYSGKIPIFGVCLGMQGIGEVFGAALLNLPTVFHGKATKMKVVSAKNVLFQHVPDEFLAGRYHSWVIDKNTLPDEFKITAEDEYGEVMAIEHKAVCFIWCAVPPGKHHDTTWQIYAGKFLKGGWFYGR